MAARKPPPPPAAPQCPACKRAPVSKQHMCPSCLSRAWCSARCLEEGKRTHRSKECLRQAWATFSQQCETRQSICEALFEAGKFEEADKGFEKLIPVAEMGLLYKGADVEVRAWLLGF